jgi:type IV fimbrial biogenesis protein FimT
MQNMMHPYATMKHAAHPRATGFTLLELMVTLAVLGILLGIAVPSFQSSLTNSRLTTAANDLVGALQAARSEAIKRNATHQFCVDTTTRAWQVLDSNNAILRQGQINPGIAITAANLISSGNQRCVRFRSDGLPYNATPALLTNGSLTLTLNSRNRTVNIQLGGIYAQ